MPDGTDVNCPECYFCEQPILPGDRVWTVNLAHFIGLEKHYGPDTEAHADCGQRTQLTMNLVSDTLDQMGVVIKGCQCDLSSP